MKAVGRLFLFAVIITFITSCSGSGYISLKDMLKDSGRTAVPAQEDFPEDGAVILNERHYVKLYFDEYFDLKIERNYKLAFVYFNESADFMLKNKINLGPGISLFDFNAKITKTNGRVIELSDKDLVLPDGTPFTGNSPLNSFAEFSFPEAQNGDIIEFSYNTIEKNAFFSYDLWSVQKSVPVLYTRYSLETPDLLYLNGPLVWQYTVHNLDLPEVKDEINAANDNASLKNKSKTVYWDFKNIPALKSESFSLPYRDIAKYATFSLKRKDWDELTEIYWDNISPYFDETSYSRVEQLANEVAAGETDQVELIRKVYNYTQQKYRYISGNISETGLIPRDIADIFTDKTADCIDMAVLNVNLLRALGIDAYPALVNTKNRQQYKKSFFCIDLDFDHMTTLAETSDGKKFWLDARKAPCILGQVPAELEGKEAYVIGYDGKMTMHNIPESKSRDNAAVRNTELYLTAEGKITGETEVIYSGHENIAIRRALKNVPFRDMENVIKGYVKSNVGELLISGIEYDNPNAAADTFRFKFHFEHNAAVENGGFAIDPFVFAMESDYDKFPGQKRIYSVRYFYPYLREDNITINFDGSSLQFSDELKPYTSTFGSGGSFSVWVMEKEDNKLRLRRKFELNEDIIPAFDYDNFRETLEAAQNANNNRVIFLANKQ